MVLYSKPAILHFKPKISNRGNVLTLTRRLNAGLPSGCYINIDRNLFISFFSSSPFKCFHGGECFLGYVATAPLLLLGLAHLPLPFFSESFLNFGVWSALSSLFIAVLVFNTVEKATK